MAGYGNRSGGFTRPADTTAYASGDLVANSTTAGSVAPITLTCDANAKRISRLRVQKSGTTATNAQFRVHVYQASPTVANGDNGAWSTNKSADYLGSADVTLVAFTDGCLGFVTCEFYTTAQTVYVLLEARAAYTPASGETFSVIAEYSLP